MKLVYHTRHVSAHEMPLFEALAQRCSEAVYVAESDSPVAGRVGWMVKLPRKQLVVLNRLGPDAQAELWTRLLTADTLVYYGYRDSPWREKIAASEAHVVYAGERWLRPNGWIPGCLRFLSPRFCKTVRWYRKMLATRPNFHCFAQGVHALRDFRRLGFANVKPWGYFIEAGPDSQDEGDDGGRSNAKPGNELRILSLGRLVPLKHVDTIMLALAEMRDCKATLTIAGDGPSRNDLENLARRLGLGDRVKFAGAVPMAKVRRFMRDHDVFVLASDAREGWGMTVSEALAEGLSVFGTNEAGASATILPPERRFAAGDWMRLRDLLESPLARERMTLPQEWTTAWAAEQLMTPSVNLHSRDRVAACFWEEHCTECGEPHCYRTCPLYSKGLGGRCRRFEGGLEETILGEGFEATFLPWGKIEAYFHGKLVTVNRARHLERLMRRTEWLRRLFPRFWRSWRWRHALIGGESGAPKLWIVRATAERDTSLALQVVDLDRRELARGALCLSAGKTGEARLVLPTVEDGFLFRIFPTAGDGTGRIHFDINTLLANVPHPAAASHIKCVAWDLDGTLWNGTLSEDGVEALELNEEAVRLIRDLDTRGIVNSIASKNDPAPVKAALEKFGIEEYFVFPQVNWGPKSESLRRLAKEMNIGLDAIAFVDDREENRNEVRANAPEVKVVNNLEELVGLGCSDGLGSSRRKMYREEMLRRNEREKFNGDAAEFLAASEISYQLLPVDGERIIRCRELVQRTNQLNLTGRRYDEAAFANLLNENSCHAVHVNDKYGDYGIVGFVAMRGTHIVECCFSCRVAEKGIEKSVLEQLAAGRKLTADIVASPRNEKIRRIVGEFLEDGAMQ